ncbi:MAG TPA: hypothetical protein VLX92_34655 [Kofleriaceae bacterium]|nr:hypothetical protein [Kofleriaceae bacterium]
MTYRPTLTGVKVFSATLAEQRARLGDVVTDWLAARGSLTILDVVVTQSSDARFHCLAIIVFFSEPTGPRPA